MDPELLKARQQQFLDLLEQAAKATGVTLVPALFHPHVQGEAWDNIETLLKTTKVYADFQFALVKDWKEPENGVAAGIDNKV